MIHALTAKNKLGFIDGSLQAPSQEEKPTEFALWNQCNSLILSWLTHSVETDMAEGVIHAKTAYQVWSDFKDQFSQKNAPAIFQIQKSIATISQGSMSVASYYTKLKALWDELENYRDPYTCDHAKAHQEQLQEDRLMQFLMGLNESYKGVRSNILMMTPLPNVRQAYSLVIQEQTQRQLSSEPEPTENFTIAANVQSKVSGIKNTKTCDHCHRSGHTIEECRTLKHYCKFCDKSGHTEDRCRRKNNKAGPPQQNRASRSKPQSAANMAENSNMNDDNSLMSFSPEYLQQLAKALSTMNQNSSSGNSDVFANATAAESKISEPHIALDSSSPAHNSAPSPSPQDPPLSPQNNRPLPINSTLSSPQIFPLSESSSSSPPQPNDNFQHLRHSTHDRQPPAWHQEYFMSAAVNHSSPRTSPRRHTSNGVLRFEDWKNDLLAVKIDLNKGYFIEKFNLGLDWNLYLKLHEFKRPTQILFEAYLQTKIEEVGLQIDTLEDKGDFRRWSIDLGSDFLMMFECEEIVNRNGNDDSNELCHLSAKVVKVNPDVAWEDLDKPRVDEEPQVVAMKYEDTYQYQNNLAPLIKLEDEYGNIMKESLSRDDHTNYIKIYEKHESSQVESTWNVKMIR
ncbi:hypothetical protein ACH5RR_026606 [Cinchona calisaya]|uniref:Retrotransposon gag domain-containing protein n=1 Tax=Cinchona calisaya TaxID=153742 RepID=A0ABD2Z470_9GENT